MKYVLDSNVGLKWVLSETDSDAARRLRDDFHAASHELIVPDIFPVECLHALLKAERQKSVFGAASDVKADRKKTLGLSVSTTRPFVSVAPSGQPLDTGQ